MSGFTRVLAIIAILLSAFANATETKIGPETIQVAAGEAMEIVSGGADSVDLVWELNLGILYRVYSVKKGHVIVGPAQINLLSKQLISYNRVTALGMVQIVLPGVTSLLDQTVDVPSGQRAIMLTENLAGNYTLTVQKDGKSSSVYLQGGEEFAGPCSLVFHCDSPSDRHSYVNLMLVGNNTVTTAASLPVEPGMAHVVLEQSSDLVSWTQAAFAPMALSQRSFFRLRLAQTSK